MGLYGMYNVLVIIVVIIWWGSHGMSRFLLGNIWRTAGLSSHVKDISGWQLIPIWPSGTPWKRWFSPMKITPSLRWRRIQESVAIISLSCLQRTWRFFKKTELWVMESAGAEPRVEMIWVSQMLTYKWCCDDCRSLTLSRCPSACNSGPVSVFLAYHFCSQSSSESPFDIHWSSNWTIVRKSQQGHRISRSSVGFQSMGVPPDQPN